ncbi:MAG: hypothetical protein LBQ60_06920 [Bacteroidales bacterium]|jgi:hypothetical protein|nr:hypothetical protein [Bacteroidales bacterium]
MKNIIISTVLLCGLLMSCSDDETKIQEEKGRLEEMGKIAAIELCDCHKEKSVDDCVDELTKNYSSSDYLTNTFVETVNKHNTCNIELKIIQVPK